jgi:hypothetical protein
MKSTKIESLRMKRMLSGFSFIDHTLAFLISKKYSVRNSESETKELISIIVAVGIPFALKSSLIKNQYVKCCGNLWTEQLASASYFHSVSHYLTSRLRPGTTSYGFSWV